MSVHWTLQLCIDPNPLIIIILHSSGLWGRQKDTQRQTTLLLRITTLCLFFKSFKFPCLNNKNEVSPQVKLSSSSLPSSHLPQIWEIDYLKWLHLLSCEPPTVPFSNFPILPNKHSNSYLSDLSPLPLKL